MHLKSLELHGFKSFPDKIKLTFNRGLTAVVGPNGSGKSNISDAIRWVMGEQSTKNLRGAKMEDVIFGGTQARKPQGFAQVSLTLDNTERDVDIDSDEVTITRKLYRSGESEYRINGNNVRLRDIHELFMAGMATPSLARERLRRLSPPRAPSAGKFLRRRRESPNSATGRQRRKNNWIWPMRTYCGCGTFSPSWKDG